MISLSNEIITSTVIICSSFSLISTLLILLSIYFDKSTKESYNLKLIFRLLSSNCGLSICIILYYIIRQISSADSSIVCAVYLPFPMYFFLTSYGWTIMIALRFKHSHNSSDKAYQPNIPFAYIWIASFILILPIIITNSSIYPGVSSVQSNTLGCTFNHQILLGEIIDLITIQTPLVITIFINVYSYIIGLIAIRDSPHSVVARQMRRVGGYLFVLLLVWLPNMIFNIFSIAANSNTEYLSLFQIGIALSSLQGFLNVCVYIISNKKMRKWISQAFCLYKLFNSKQSNDNNSNIPTNNNEDTKLETSSSFTDFTPQGSFNGSFRGSNTNGILKKYINNSNIAPIVRNDDKSQVISTKVNITQNKSAPITIQELDSEKYVRFGGITTKVISTSFSRFTFTRNSDESVSNLDSL